jgi:ABC-type Fe3+ transport system permease subunit
VFFLYPVIRMLGFSVEDGHLNWYAKALGEGLYLQVFWNTFEIALFVTFFCLLLGYPLGFLIATTTPGWATLGFIFVLLPLIIALLGFLTLVVYSIFPTYDLGVRENITAVTVISVWISGCLLALNLTRWYLARRQRTLVGTLADGKRLLYHLSPSFQAIPVCAFGLVNAVLPWWVTQTTFYSTEWYTGFSDHWGAKPLFLNSLWLPLGLFLVATGGQERLRFRRAGAILAEPRGQVQRVRLRAARRTQSRRAARTEVPE